MKPKHVCLLVSVLAGVAATAPAQSGAPTLTSSVKLGRELQVSITHEARSWQERKSKRKLGTIQTKQPISLGEQAVGKGTFTLAIRGDDDDGGWALQVLPKKRKERALAWPLQPGDEESRALRLAFLVDGDGAVRLDVEFGKLRASLPVSSIAAAEAKLKQDPAIRAVDAMLKKASIDKKSSSWRTKMPKPEPATFDAKRKYFWHLETSEGAITIRFMPDVAPMHVTSTISLTRAGFYDGLAFHRVIDGFMAQGGCSSGTGSGSCGYQYDGEFRDDVVHDRGGLLSMANSGPGTDGSQFFITFAPTPHLDGKHTIFGEVVSGMKAVERLEQAGTQSGAPKKKLTIKKATISIK